MTATSCTNIASLREHVSAWRARGLLVALVPTMGALHEGHLSLVREAREVADRVIVTIFVNPTQFAPTDDFSAYPRDLEKDCAMVEESGADLVYAPEVATMYPAGFTTAIKVDGPATVGLEDRFRPTHFVGVATVVMKLLMQALPNIALFGEKDYQQLKLIQRMMLDLDVPIGILGMPTVRESDGLAMSSRNARLSAQERALAPKLHAELVRCATALAEGAQVEEATAAARASLQGAGFAVDYVEARHADTLASLSEEDEGPARVLAAARLGSVRLIDNVAVG